MRVLKTSDGEEIPVWRQHQLLVLAFLVSARTAGLGLLAARTKLPHAHLRASLRALYAAGHVHFDGPVTDIDQDAISRLTNEGEKEFFAHLAGLTEIVSGLPPA